MPTQNENLFVKLVKKSVGLPTGKSDCCGVPAGVQSSACCGTSNSSDCCGAETSNASQSGCGCGKSDCGGECCGAEASEKKVESEKET